MSVTYYHRMIRDIFVRLIIYCSPSAGVLHMPAVMHVTPIQLLFTVMNFALFCQNPLRCAYRHTRAPLTLAQIIYYIVKMQQLVFDEIFPNTMKHINNNLYLYVDCNNNAII